MKIIRPLLVACAAVVAIPALFLTLRRPVQADFRTEARTEIIRGTINGNKIPTWTFNEASLKFGDSACIDRFTGKVTPESNTHFRVQRVASGSLWLFLDRAGVTVAQVDVYGDDWDFDSTFAVIGGLVIEIPGIKNRLSNDSSITFHVTGYIELGLVVSGDGEPGVDVPVLYSGHGKILSERLCGASIFEAAKYELRRGDRFRTMLRGGSECSYGIADIICDESPGLKAVLSSKGVQAWVSGFGRTAYSIEASRWDRIRNDPDVQTLWVFAGFFFGVWVFVRERKKS